MHLPGHCEGVTGTQVEGQAQCQAQRAQAQAHLAHDRRRHAAHTHARAGDHTCSHTVSSAK